MAVPFFVYLIDRHLGFLFLWATIYDAAMNFPLHVFVRTHVFNFLGYTPRVELLGRIFEELQNCFSK